MKKAKIKKYSFFYFLRKILSLKLAYYGLLPPPLPITFTFSVTNLCQSRCLTCKIWDFYRQNPELEGKELTLEEIARIFAGINRPIYFFNVSGGEPFLREDLAEIIKIAGETIRPDIIHIPTNGLNPEKIEKTTWRITEYLKELNWKGILTIKPSLDAVGEMHDKIRGIPGNFEKVMETFKKLKAIKKKFPNLSVEAGTIISKFNLAYIDEITSFVKNLGIDNYRNEIAELRAELLNQQNDITPTFQEYKKISEMFKRKILEDIQFKSSYAQKTQAFRLVYYDLTVEILKEKRQVIPCLAGLANVHLSAFGDLWPCCVLGKNYSFGNLREFDYNFSKIWRGEKAKKIREFIKGKNCYCPLANQAYNNMLCNLARMIKVLNVFRRIKTR